MIGAVVDPAIREDVSRGRPARRGAVALCTTLVYVIPVTTLSAHMESSDITPQEILSFFNDEIARLEEHLSLEKLTAEEKVATFVLWALDKLSARPLAGSVLLPMSQKDIGNYLGLVPATISRVLSRFEHRQWLSLKRRKLIVTDLAQLRLTAGGHGH